MPEHLIIALARSIVQFQPSGMKCVADFIELYIKDLNSGGEVLKHSSHASSQLDCFSGQTHNWIGNPMKFDLNEPKRFF